MTNSIEQICNQALSDIGGRVSITDFLNDTTPAAIQCRLWYDTMRQALLQAAPWSFARKTAALTQLALITDSPMPSGMYPWGVKYLYPADCLRMNYILPPPLPPAPDGTPNVSGGPMFSNWGMPSRANRFLPSYDEVVVVSPPSTTPREVILSNIQGAYGVYVADVILPTMFNASFSLALTAAMSYKLVMAITGNAGMKGAFRQIAEDAITSARVKDGNEASPSSDHTPDWIAGRGSGGLALDRAGVPALGQWYNGYSDVSWGE